MFGKRLVNGKFLRRGFTTGSCAAAAARGAVTALLSGVLPDSVTLSLPGGEYIELEIECGTVTAASAKCAVRKSGGDDPDITDGILVFAEVSRRNEGICIDGGDGVGRVTRAGLDQPVGEAAINSVPREMIRREVAEACAEFGYAGGIDVIISIPDGEKLAARTFNPRLGIVGGLSVLGTSGIVEPMSNAAIVDTIRAELGILRASGETDLLITPGNLGERFSVETLGIKPHVKSSNFIGETLEIAAELGFMRLLLVAHVGKLVKLGIGVTNTHSAFGDGRIETLIACALRAGAEINLLRELDECVTTDSALAALKIAGLLASAMEILQPRVEDTLRRRLPPEIEVGFVCFTNAPERHEVLFKSANADALTKLLRKDTLI